MKTLPLLSIALTVSIAAPLSAREWTSADGSKSFEADFVSAADGEVTVRRSNGQTTTFAVTLLSEADQEFINTKKIKATGGGGGSSWPRWRGLDLSDHSPDTGLLKEWPADGKERVWMFEDAGKGYSGPAIADGKLFTMGARDAICYLIALDANTGEELWVTEMDALLRNNWGDGPRGTPTVDGARVYALSGKGTLICVGAADGKKIWSKDLTEDFRGKPGGWGYTESVLVDGDNVVCTPGGGDGAILALNKMTGDKVWQSSEVTDGAQYASIVPIEHGGKRQYVQLFQKKLVGVAADGGKLIWSSPWTGRTAVIPTPIYKDGLVYIASGYGVGCKLVELGADGAKEVYKNEVMVNHHGGVVLVDGHLYGHSDKGGWKCQNLETGEEVWAEQGVGKGAVHYADGMLYCLGEKDGTVALVEASPEGYKEKSRFKLDPQTEIRSDRGKIWTHPVVVGGKLYLRDQDLIYCYDVKG